MPAKRLKHFLENNDVQYRTLNHPVAFSALEISEVAHVPGKDLMKTVIVKTPHDFKMAVIRANDVLDIDKLKEVINEQDVTLATEQEFASAFPDCEVGAMPPFGNLYEMDVILSDALLEDEEVFFNAGNHSEIIKLPFTQYQSLVHPKVAKITHQ